MVAGRLIPELLKRGDEVVAVTRKQPKPDAFPAGVSVRVIDVTKSAEWEPIVATADAVVNLAGANLFAKRWTESVKAELRSSRVDVTHAIAMAIAKRPQTQLISTSAVGLYGDRGDEVLEETSSAATDFLGQLAIDWEAAADPARDAGARVVHPRFGIVLDPRGGALPSLARPFKLFGGGRLGSGKQFVSWIHHTDLTRLLMFMLDKPDLAGPVNATAPTPIRNAELATLLGKVLGRPNWLPAPRFGLKIMLGEVVDVLLASQRAVPARALAAGFTFNFPSAESALIDLLQQESAKV